MATSKRRYTVLESSLRAPVPRITHTASPVPTKACAVRGGQYEIPRTEEPHVVLDDQDALAREHQEVL
jgi:hypothetical protein